jgi:hypothetical protein
MSLGNSLDQTVEPKAPQLVAHASWSESFKGLSQKRGEVSSQVAVRKTSRQQVE